MSSCDGSKLDKAYRRAHIAACFVVDIIMRVSVSIGETDVCLNGCISETVSQKLQGSSGKHRYAYNYGNSA